MSRICVAILFSLTLLFAAAPCVNASIIAWDCNDDGDGAIVMSYSDLSGIPGPGPYTLDMDGKQHWAPAHVVGHFTTDTELDPTVWFMEEVENDTTFAWTDYHITIGMNKNFSILSTGVVTPPDWTYSITQPVPGTVPNDGAGWVGVVDYYVGTGSPVATSAFGDFGFKVSFTGSVQFATEQVPTPEPATVALLGLGALAVMRKRRA